MGEAPRQLADVTLAYAAFLDSIEEDSERISFVTEALEGVLRCISDGLQVLGYTYWSLLDNFEWALGYGPKFGLIAVDRERFDRTPKPSAAWFEKVARANALVTP